MGYRHVISSCGGVPAAGSSSQWSSEEGNDAEAWCKVLVGKIVSASRSPQSKSRADLLRSDWSASLKKLLARWIPLVNKAVRTARPCEFVVMRRWEAEPFSNLLWWSLSHHACFHTRHRTTRHGTITTVVKNDVAVLCFAVQGGLLCSFQSRSRDVVVLGCDKSKMVPLGSWAFFEPFVVKPFPKSNITRASAHDIAPRDTAPSRQYWKMTLQCFVLQCKVVYCVAFKVGHVMSLCCVFGIFSLTANHSLSQTPNSPPAAGTYMSWMQQVKAQKVSKRQQKGNKIFQNFWLGLGICLHTKGFSMKSIFDV